MVALSITALSAFGDLGLGNGILTLLPAALAADNTRRARVLVSTSYMMLLGMAILIVGIVVVAIWTGASKAVFGPTLTGVNGPSAAELVVAVTISGFAASLPLNLVQRIQYAVQQAWLSSIWQIGSALATVVAVYSAVWLGWSPVAVVAAASMAPLVVLLLNNFVFFIGRYRVLRPALRFVRFRESAGLIRLGVGFLGLSILTSIALNVDNLLVAHLADLTTVAYFSIAVRLFSVLSLAVTLVALPLWPANSDALARGDVAWVRKTTRTIVLASVGAVLVGGMILVLCRDWVVELWLGDNATVGFGLALGLTIWSCTLAACSPLFSVQNAKGVLHFQALGWGIYLLVSIPLKSLAFAALGVAGIPFAGVTGYVLLIAPLAYVGYRRTLSLVQKRKDEGIEEHDSEVE